MKSNRNIIYFFRNLGKKHRLSLHDEHNESEVWYMHISPLKIIGGIVAVVLILFIIILTTVAYTPVLNLIPGYSGNKQREQMIQNILRVDSIQHKINEIEAWGYDVSLIMEGKTPFVRDVTQAGDTIKVSKLEVVFRNEQDSLLRSLMEGGGEYGLSRNTGRRGAGIDLQNPVRGIISSNFSPKDSRFGVAVATASNEQVLAVGDGTVIFSSWAPGEGYTVQIQHADNLISLYRHLSQSMVTVGGRVRRGEVVGFTIDGSSDEEGKWLFELQLWHNGMPVDPENYIVF